MSNLTFTQEQYQAVMAELNKAREENLALRASKTRALSFKVSEKGAISVYGIHTRFPVTLYANQWQRLLAPNTVDALNTFIAENRAYLSTEK